MNISEEIYQKLTCMDVIVCQGFLSALIKLHIPKPFDQWDVGSMLEHKASYYSFHNYNWDPVSWDDYDYLYPEEVEWDKETSRDRKIRKRWDHK